MWKVLPFSAELLNYVQVAVEITGLRTSVDYVGKLHLSPLLFRGSDRP